MRDKINLSHERLQQIMETLRAGMEVARNNRWARLTRSNAPIEQESQETIEQVPEQEPVQSVSWLDRPRVRTHGFFTNLSTSGHVTIKDNGGEIN